MTRERAMPAPFRKYRTIILFSWALVPLVALALLAATTLTRTARLREIPISLDPQQRPTICWLATADARARSAPPILLLYPADLPPVGILPLLDDWSRHGAWVLACPLHASSPAALGEAAIRTLEQHAAAEMGSGWIVSTGLEMGVMTSFLAQHTAAGWVAVNPPASTTLPTPLATPMPVAMLATGEGMSRADEAGTGTLHAWYEVLSGEDAWLLPPATASGPTRAHTWLAADGNTRLTLYPGTPPGLEWIVPLIRDDVARWMGHVGENGQLGNTRTLLLPLDAACLFVIGALTAALLFGSLARQGATQNPAPSPVTRNGLLVSGAVVLVCMACGLLSRFLWSRPLVRWQPFAAGVLVLVFRTMLRGLYARVRGRGTFVGRVVVRGLDLLDLLACLLAAGVGLWLAGPAFFSRVAAVWAAVCAWGYSRAVGGLSHSRVCGDVSAAIVLATFM